MEDGNQPGACQTQQLFLPDEKGILCPQDKLHFTLCCGVATTCHRALERSELIADHLSLWVQPFGAHEDLPTRLKNILKEYSAPVPDMVKEVLQNVGNAGVLVCFMRDRQQHPAKATFSEKWNILQSPALCIYSDCPFLQQDIESIQHLEVCGKQDQQDVTGKYGLGFNTVYCFTDCPAFLTKDSTLCVFDSHFYCMSTAATEQPSSMFAVDTEFTKNFPDI
ncbi:hypothetical protein Nmel_014842 [Mimus melanotis]